jgi:hypothetical protein
VPYPENHETEIVFTASHLLATMRNGAANEAATKELEKLVKAIQESHDDKAKGFVNLKIKVCKLKDGETELKVDMVVTSSIPVASIPSGIYFADDNGALHRTDPRQLSMIENMNRKEGDINRVGRGTVIEHA